MLQKLKITPKDPLFYLLGQYEKDANIQKINFGLGIFLTERASHLLCQL